MTNEAQGGITVETATGPVFLPDGVPDWVTENLIASAGGLIEQLVQPPTVAVAPGVNLTDAPAYAVAPVTQESGQFVTTANGPIWIPDGAPDWLVMNLIESNGGLAFGADPPRSTTPGVAGGVPAGPVGPSGPGPTSFPAPVPAPTPKPSPGARPPQSFPGAVVDAARAAADAASRLAGAAAGAVATAAGDVGSLLAAVKAGATDAIMRLVPTVSELALGLTSRFADLASWLGGNLMEAADFAETMAGGLASGMSVVFDDAWHWLFDSLAWLGSLLVGPLQKQIDEWTYGLQAEAL